MVAKYLNITSYLRNRAYEPFATEWTAEEELKLLEGLMEFRFGNWEYVLTLVDHFISCVEKSPLMFLKKQNDNVSITIFNAISALLPSFPI